MTELSQTLEPDSLGIWRANQPASVSYPADGNQKCFALEEASLWYRHRNQCLLATIARYPPEGFILDVGGGNGFVTQALLQAGFSAVLLEPDPIGATLAKTQRHLPEVICASLENAGLQHESVPAVGLFDVLEHIEDDQGFLKRIATILKPGGLFYASVPAYSWLWSLSDLQARHHRRYQQRQLMELLTGRFDLLYCTYFFAPLLLPIFFLRTLPFRLGFTKNRNFLSPIREHCVQGGTIAKVLSHFLSWELNRVQKGQRIPLGTSCLLVARKKS